MNLESECLLAVVGLRDVLEPGDLKITAAQRREAQFLPKHLRAKVRAFLAASPTGMSARALTSVDHDEVIGLLSQDWVARFDENFAPFEDDPEGEEKALGFAGAARAAIDYLNSVAPRRARLGVFWSESDEPSRSELSAFRRAWDVASQPATVLKDLHDGVLGDEQVEAMALAYPNLLQFIRDELVQAVAGLKSWRTRWEPGGRKLRQLETLMGATADSPELLEALQGTFTADKEEIVKAARSGREPKDMLSTSTQRVADR